MTSAIDSTLANPPARTVVLLQSEGYVHDVVKPADDRPSVVEQTLTNLAKRTNSFDPTFMRQASDVTSDRLTETDLLILYTTGPIPLDVDALDRWLKDGGALLGIHCATDTLMDHPLYPRIIGGTFDGHPWNADAVITLKVHDPDHPAATCYAPAATFQEEIYQFRDFDPTRVHVLMGLDMERTQLKRPHHVPVAWCRDYGKGRVLYTSLGHRQDVWESDAYQAHLAGAIDWLLGRADGDATPNPLVHQREGEIARAAFVNITRPEAPSSSEEVQPSPQHNVLTEQEKRDGWRLLFAGETLDGWRGFRQDRAPDGWQVADGCITRVGPGGDLITVEQFDDFELSLEWRVDPGSNSGIFYRVSEDESAVYLTGSEMQVLDNQGHPDGQVPETSAGSNYALYAPSEDVTRPVGQFNHARIVVHGDHVEHHLNGVMLLEYDLGSEDWQRRVDASKFRDWPRYGRQRRGHIAVQDHGDPVWYRNIRIRVLAPEQD